jgi:hypothetical protein
MRVTAILAAVVAVAATHVAAVPKLKVGLLVITSK